MEVLAEGGLEELRKLSRRCLSSGLSSSMTELGPDRDEVGKTSPAALMHSPSEWDTMS